jgi:hypothetical protein
VPENARKTRWYSTGGPWGTGLLLLGCVWVIVGMSWITRRPGALPEALAWINRALPISAWAVLWVVAGAYSIIRALLPPQRHIDLAPAVFVASLWGGFYATYWLIRGIDDGAWTRDWVSALIWGCVAGLLVCFGRCVNPPRRRRRR